MSFNKLQMVLKGYPFSFNMNDIVTTLSEFINSSSKENSNNYYYDDLSRLLSFLPPFSCDEDKNFDEKRNLVIHTRILETLKILFRNPENRQQFEIIHHGFLPALNYFFSKGVLIEKCTNILANLCQEKQNVLVLLQSTKSQKDDVILNFLFQKLLDLKNSIYLDSTSTSGTTKTQFSMNFFSSSFAIFQSICAHVEGKEYFIVQNTFSHICELFNILFEKENDKDNEWFQKTFSIEEKN